MKTLTSWKPADSGTATDDNAGFHYLMETGDSYLQEDGTSYYLLEDGVISTKLPETWTLTTKAAVSWKVNDGFGVFTSTSYTRTTIAGDTRTTETGDTRVTEGSVETDKAPTQWTEN